MRPQTLPLITDFKKEYKFVWVLCTSLSDAFNVGNLSKEGIIYKTTIQNPAFQIYVSQLAENVTIPDDEFDIENIQQGCIEYKMPKKVKTGDITVTYLDDSMESVYTFHKAWFRAIRCGDGVGINSPSQFPLSAKYITFEDTMLASEYLLVSSTVAKLNSVLNLANINLPTSAKPTGMTTYPRIYPTKIQRSPANHAGEGLGRVTVTYSRIPNFYVNHTPLQMLDPSTGRWNNSRDGGTGMI